MGLMRELSEGVKKRVEENREKEEKGNEVEISSKRIESKSVFVSL